MSLDLKILVVLLTCFVGTFVGVGLQRRVALAKGILDVPNARSSHVRPVPRGGGLAIFVVVGLCIATLAVLAVVPLIFALALLVPGTMVAGVGFVDDLRGVSARARFGIQFVAAVAALVLLGGWSPEWAQPGSITWLMLQALTVTGVVWAINLFNFMDGIDGIAGSEAVYLGLSGALLMTIESTAPEVAFAALLVGVSGIGFLLWNWPPAKIFMGDVGSGFLGLVFAVLAVAAGRQEPLHMFAWVILGGSFLVDSSATLVRRLVRRERVYEAHRTHAYQWLARRFSSHASVTLLYSAVNLLWLLPMAWLSMRLPEYAPWITAAALSPVLAGALAAGAGRQERRDSGVADPPIS